MSEKKRIYKPTPISGFPEWLPEERLVEQQWFDHIRKTFESFGFCSIETPSVEALDAITAKGEVDKEIYVLERLHEEEGADERKVIFLPENEEPDLNKYRKFGSPVVSTNGEIAHAYIKINEARLALHFDQTVPMARYVAQHFSNLVFPFKRYQMQRVWRGERPQMGRMREFYQCDIDVIHVDNLPLSFDAEVAAVMYEVLDGLNAYADIGKVQLRINNRKIVTGVIEALGIFTPEQSAHVIRIIDKREKLSNEEFEQLIWKAIKDSDARAPEASMNVFQKFFKMADSLKKETIKGQLQALRGELKTVNDNETYHTGLDELAFVIENLSHLPQGSAVADLTIVRGLDYYTGTVYETQLLDVPEFTGSVCSGGRYDDLAGSFINKHLPGVGISIGFSRLFDVMRQTGRLKNVGRKGPADVLMVLPSEEKRSDAAATARLLRANGVKVEMYHAPQKVGKQMEYASKKQIPYVWFPPFEDGKDHEVKNMSTGEQATANPQTWTPA